MIVDFQHHYLPKVLWEKHGGRPGRESIWYERGVRKLSLRDLDYQIEKHLEAMDGAGIDAAVLTSWEPSLADARLLNNDLAALQRKYPKRIIGFAHAPPLGGKKALQELERGINDLGLRGAATTGHVRGRSLDSEELAPMPCPLGRDPILRFLWSPFRSPRESRAPAPSAWTNRMC